MGDGWTHVVRASPWPVRNGRRCRVVESNGRDHYPWNGLGRRERVVLIEDDPLSSVANRARGWSCVLREEHMRLL